MSQLPVAPDAPARAPLRRADDGAMIAGVAQGLAAHLGLSPNTVRLAFVILALFSGAGALAYGVLWVLVPRATGPALPAGLETATTEETIAYLDRLFGAAIDHAPLLANRASWML